MVDTLARHFSGGDENNTADMNLFVANLDRLRLATGAAILVVHHSGLADGKRGRGSSVLRAALDFEYSMERVSESPSTVVKLSCSKCKDHERVEDRYLSPEVVDLLESDEDGQALSSIVLCEADPVDIPAKQGRRLKGAALTVFQALYDLSDGGAKSVLLETWREHSVSVGLSSSERPEAQRQAFHRAKTNLLNTGRISQAPDGGFVTGQGATTGGCFGLNINARPNSTNGGVL